MTRVSPAVTIAWLLLLLPSVIFAQEGAVQGIVVSEGRPVDGVVVHLDPEGEIRAPPTEPATAVVDQSQLRFLPPVVVGRPGLTVEFLNSDPILHNVFSPGWSGEAFDLGTYPSNSSRSHTFTEPGPHVILCHVHPEMVAYVVVVTTPYHAVTDAQGRFRISSVQPGSYSMGVWRRGSDPRSEPLVVPAGGTGELVLNLSNSDQLVERSAR